MQFTAGDTITITVAEAVLVVKIEDASKSDTISARVEEVKKGSAYTAGQICEFNRNDIKDEQ